MKKIPILRTEDRQYIASLKNLIIISLLIFVAASISGYLSSSIFPELPERVLENFDESLKKVAQFSNLELFIFIFTNNAIKILAVTALGVFLGLIPMVFLLSNGFVVGLVAFTAIQSIGLTTFWLGIIPHGIFEIPALIFGAAAGFHLGDLSFKRIFIKKKVDFKNEIKKVSKFSLKVVLPLIFIAAFIEVFITSAIIR